MMNLKKYTISRDDDIYEAWPDVVRTESGKLVCVFAECDQHPFDREYTRIMMSVSMDDGVTWSEKVPLTEGTYEKNYCYNCPRISKLSDGRLVVIVDKIDRVYGGYKDSFFATNILLLSGDEGRNWSEPVITPAKGIVPDKLRELDNGRWLITCHCRFEDRFVQRLWYSDDKGDSWSGPIICAQDVGLDLCEASILPVRSQPGVLVAFLRENSLEGKDCYKTISYDNGLTWSDPVAFPLPGCHRPVAGYLEDGRIFITYRFLQGGKGELCNWSQNFFGAFTDEESILATSRRGASTRIFPIAYDPSEQCDLGYSGWVQLNHGEVYIVTYIVDDSPKAQIRGYLLQLPPAGKSTRTRIGKNGKCQGEYMLKSDREGLLNERRYMTNTVEEFPLRWLK